MDVREVPLPYFEHRRRFGTNEFLEYPTQAEIYTRSMEVTPAFAILVGGRPWKCHHPPLKAASAWWVRGCL